MGISGRPYKVKCPKCKRKRVGPDYRYWEKVDGILVCGWCADPKRARQENELSRKDRKEKRKEIKAQKIAPFVWPDE